MLKFHFFFARFKLNEKAIQILKEESRPITVISILGQYRTGKSFLLNQLLRKNGRSNFPSFQNLV